MKRFGKTSVLFALVTVGLAFNSCKPNAEEVSNYTITTPTGLENTVTIDKATKTITLEPPELKEDEEGYEYVIKGTFYGQIINKTKGTKIVLDNAHLKNTKGKAAVYSDVKTEIKCKKDTTNTITVTGAADETKGKGAVFCNKAGFELGGAGDCTITCANGHGIKAKRVEIKGQGEFVIDGGNSSSGINCNKFEVKEDRTFTLIVKNSKTGIKADNTIDIASGTYKFENITKNALITDTHEDDDEGETKEHYIKLTGGNFTFTNCGAKYKTEENGFTKEDAVTGNF